jgi:hypothetical protein
LAKRTIAIAGVFMMAAAGSAAAHHSVYGAFDKDKSRPMRAVVTKVNWINPHIVFQVETKGANGAPQTWNLETQPVSFMRRAGVTKEMLLGGGKEMDLVILPPRKEGAGNVGFLIRMTTPDGKIIQFAPDK